jgi:hypothetical protein
MDEKTYVEVVVERWHGGWGDTDYWYDRFLLDIDTPLRDVLKVAGDGKIVSVEVSTEKPNDLPI